MQRINSVDVPAAFFVCAAGGLLTLRRLAVQEKQSKSEHEALLNRMCELEQMVDDAGGAMDDIAVSEWNRSCVMGRERCTTFFLLRLLPHLRSSIHLTQN